MQESLAACLADFRPERNQTTRALALYSAAIAVSDTESLQQAATICRGLGASHEQVYEVMLQSYLFLGFPRMLTAAERLNDGNAGILRDPVDAALWLERGQRLCRQVYDSNYEPLKQRVEHMAPEIFLWMELEGYGKVLSRPGLDIVDREMAIVSCLMIENRPVQLHSHLRGAINVGAAPEIIRDVISDLAPVAPDGYAAAVELMKKLGLF
ncbi:MAG: carboxymuconolactone decarboxylase family protein [Candidatus Zixiibacteriota bacterium]